MSVSSMATPPASATSFWPSFRCLERNLLASLVVFLYTQQLDWPTICLVALCAGVIPVLLGAVRGTRVFGIVSPAVVQGMLAGIGITILLSQLHVVLGGYPESHALLNLQALPALILTLQLPSVFLGLLTVALLLGWQELAPGRLRIVPGSLVALVIVTLASVLLDAPVARFNLSNGLSTGLSLPDSLLTSPWLPIASATITLALVASLVASVESLIPTVATGKWHYSIWGMVAVALLMPLIPQIPLAALAGLLIYAGIQLVNVHHTRSVTSHREIVIYFVTVAGVVCLNLLQGVALGIGLALLLRYLAKPAIPSVAA